MGPSGSRTFFLTSRNPTEVEMKTTAFSLAVFLAGIACPLLVLAAAPAGSQVPPHRPPVRQDSRAGRTASLESFLDEAVALKKRIVWTAGNGKRWPFDNWTPEMKGRIEFFHRKLLEGARNLDMRLPAADKVDPNNGQAYFTEEQAFDVYAAHVAHVLHVEAAHLVPWSIQARPPIELDQLLASSSYFARLGVSKSANQYPAGIQANRDFTETPEDSGLGEWIGDPRVGYDFLSGKLSSTHQRLIGKTELETLVNLTLWLRDNVDHGPIDGQAKERVKAQRWLENRLRAPPGSRTAMAIQGCHSASKLMVDLARSVNIPLLHTRALDNKSSDAGGHFFNGSHGGLIYGWGGPEHRILWHTDEIYAMPGRSCFPLDPATGALAAPEQAARQFFDEYWRTPQQLRKAGFVYRLERVLPGKGYGQHSRGDYEDRLDYGMLCGRWEKKGNSDLSQLHELAHEDALYAGPFLQLAAKHVVEAQLASNIQASRGDFADGELLMLRPIRDYVKRAESGLKAVGGPEALDKRSKAWERSRGSNLLGRRQP
jgi:hypothetical protein